MAALVDTNVIIRFLVGDHEEHLHKAIRIFEEIENGTLEVEILSTVLMEALFVLTRFYNIPKKNAVSDLKAILSLEGVINRNKIILSDALTLYLQRNIDFVDALILTKSQLQGYDRISFDHDLA
ncbi:MAG TPA: type II toxin-antitoxin system VapC family toxin [Gammaproteobacteria bacterium]|nr:type II toxin-antitoxin system VapC family toxin [Gammaproteobacteria bacterium]